MLQARMSLRENENAAGKYVDLKGNKSRREDAVKGGDMTHEEAIVFSEMPPQIPSRTGRQGRQPVCQRRRSTRLAFGDIERRS